MKNTIKISSIIFLMLFETNQFTVIAQKPDQSQNKEQREARKIAFFTMKMELTSDESLRFWPVVNEMEAELKALKKENADGRKMLKDEKEISDNELVEIMDARLQMSKDVLDIKIKYHEKIKEVLPINKVAKYYEANKDFKKIQARRKSHHNNPGKRIR